MRKLVEEQYGAQVPKHICPWCADFDLRGKSIEEAATHFKICTAGPKVEIEINTTHLVKSIVESPEKMAALGIDDHRQPVPLFKVQKF